MTLGSPVPRTQIKSVMRLRSDAWHARSATIEEGWLTRR